MKRLSGTDALFLSGENPAWHQHVGGFVIVDPSESTSFGFEAVQSFLLSRLALVPKYRWKLKEVPLHLDRPVWVDDTNFDIERHFLRIAVPPPGGREEVGSLVGQLMSQQLDRRIPLWQCWYIDGVAGHKVGLFIKQHHCLMDGVTGASLADQLYDLEPDPPPSEPANRPPDPSAGPEPSNLELLARSLVPAIGQPHRAFNYAVRTALRGVTIAQHLAPSGSGSLIGQPIAALNAAVGPRRKLCYVSVSLDDVRQLRKELDTKVNDIVLALCAGSLRNYLAERSELPDSPLIACVPISTKIGGEEGKANQVANMNVALATALADPLERVRAIKEATQSAKEMTRAVRARQIQSVGEVAPPLLINVASRALWASQLFSRLPAAMHLTVSNVPGPPIPLYMCGALVNGIYAASVLMANMALNITCLSYMDRIDFGITVDPDIIQEHWAIADGIPEALAELKDAAGLSVPRKVQDPFQV